MNQTYVGCSLYHLYVSMLLAADAKRRGSKSLLVLINDRVSGVEALIPGIRQLDIFEDIVSVKSYTILSNFRKSIGTFNYFFNRRGGLVKLFEKENPALKQHDAFIRNSEINLFHVVRTRAYFLIKYPKNDFRMVEEGLGTYLHKMPLTRYLKRKYLIKFPILMGYDKQVKEVLVQHPEKMRDKLLRNKSVKFEFHALQDALTPSQKEAILTCFLGTRQDFSSNKKLLVITQPLSEDRIITEEQKIKIYKHVVSSAEGQGYKVYLKSHPREFTDYQAIFPEVNLIPRLFPIEVLNLSDSFSFAAGFTVFSGALDNLRNVDKKIMLGRETLDNVDDLLRKKIQLPAFT